MARRRRRRRSTKRRRRNPTRALYRRRNPRVTFQKAATAAAFGALGGAIAYGINWGVSFIPIDNANAKTAIFAGASAATSIGLSMMADERVGCGVAGAAGYQLTHQIAAMVQTRMANRPDAGAVYTRDAGAVYTIPRGRIRTDAGAVYRREAGALVGGARTMRMPGMGGPNFKLPEAGASEYVPGPIRWYGPQSWAYKYGNRPGVRYVSAHNS